jgi:hypothetical protein
MTQDNIAVLLTLSLTPALEGPIAEWLLENEPDLGFTSMAAHGHGVNPERLSLIEQVTGRQRRVIMHIVLPAAAAAALVEKLAAVFAGTDTYYWTAPALDVGRF